MYMFLKSAERTTALPGQHKQNSQSTTSAHYNLFIMQQHFGNFCKKKQLLNIIQSVSLTRIVVYYN